jgi:hypothetical protein
LPAQKNDALKDLTKISLPISTFITQTELPCSQNYQQELEQNKTYQAMLKHEPQKAG